MRFTCDVQTLLDTTKVAVWMNIANTSPVRGVRKNPAVPTSTAWGRNDASGCRRRVRIDDPGSREEERER